MPAPRSIAAAFVAVLFALVLAGPRAEASYQAKPGETLAEIATAFYGSPHYRLPLAKLNRLPDDKTAPQGTSLRTPDLKSMVMLEGLSKEVEPEVDLVIGARYAYMQVEAELLKSLARAGKGRGAALPAEVRQKLRNAALDFETAARGFAKKGVYAESPVRIKRRLERAATALRLMADGRGDLKVAGTVHLLLAQTFTRLLTWARLED